MSITLRFVDLREDPAAKKPPEYIVPIPFPRVKLTVFRAAQMTLKRAREKGFKGHPKRYVVLVTPPGKSGGHTVSLEASTARFVQDGSTVSVVGDDLEPKRTTERWDLD